MATERRASGSLEAEVLAVLQRAAEPLTPGEVQRLLANGLSYSTVVTILSRLYAKGVLRRARHGRAYAYQPLTDEPGLVALRMHRAFDGERDHEAVLARFVSDLSPSDELVLRRLLGERATDPADPADRVDEAG